MFVNLCKATTNSELKKKNNNDSKIASEITTEVGIKGDLNLKEQCHFLLILLCLSVLLTPKGGFWHGQQRRISGNV